ncbi:hypothetical protein [Fusobacterium varium]|uniref:hypothetical protein n=1 Tax=Fusobacterium varium TaxID=856 RepID=UPI000BBAB468|nr:hypothetical protein [uncultured Fusobacterium sp.]BBA51204.1 hypothetical protein FV113G1_15530 [Fusobacterium varium]
MPIYIISQNKDNAGNNQIHTIECSFGQRNVYTYSLGWFPNEIEAIEYAKKHGYPCACGCPHCCPETYKK